MIEPSPDLQLPTKRFGPAPSRIQIVSEAAVIFTNWGYAPVVEAVDLHNDLHFLVMIGARSIAAALEPLRNGNGGSFVGLRIEIQKESEDRSSKYIIHGLDSQQAAEKIE